MKNFLIVLISIISINAYSQYNTISTIKINNIQLRLDSETKVLNTFGSPSQVKNEIDYAGDGDIIKVLCYGDSNFNFWDGKFQTFIIKNSSYSLNGKFQVGDNVNKLQIHYPNSFQNPLSGNQISDFDISNFSFDKCYWINAGGGDGILVFSKNGTITGFRYTVG